MGSRHSEDIIVVRRGRLPEYYFFMGVTARVNGATLIVDRRGAERRTATVPVGAERRTAERRRPAHRLWTQEGVTRVRGATPVAERPGARVTPLRQSKDIIVVRRGRSPEYYDLMGVKARINDAMLIVDRRQAERRAATVPVGAERRTADRRRAAHRLLTQEEATRVRGATPVAERPRARWRSVVGHAVTKLFKRA